MQSFRKLVLFAWCVAGAVHAAPPPASMELRYDRLASALTLLSDADRKIVNDAAQLIRQGENLGALARLSSLAQSNQDNSSLRILMAYAQLQLGNLTGALDEAKKAHEASNGNSYRCYFLAKVAFLTGDKVTCKHELTHAKNAGDMKDDVRQLENELKASK
jgi:Flp pilus assembly protein TadD